MIKKIFLLFFLLWFIFPGFGNPQKENTLIFDWTVLVKQKDDTVMSLDCRVPALTLARGDSFKIFVKPIKSAYIYLYHLDAKDRFFVLFPLDFKRFGSSYYSDAPYIIPRHDAWIPVNEKTGNEKIYIIASPYRHSELEDKTYKYIKSSGGKKLMQKKELIEYIRILQNQMSPLKGVSEIPVTIAGEIRGQEFTEIEVTEIHASNFYAKTIRIIY